MARVWAANTNGQQTTPLVLSKYTCNKFKANATYGFQTVLDIEATVKWLIDRNVMYSK